MRIFKYSHLTRHKMNFYSGNVPILACVLIVFQVCDCARAPQQRTKMTSTASTCPEPPPSLVMAHNHCKKMQEHAMDTMGNKNSSEVVTTMNSTDAEMMKMISKCYPLCLLKALTLVDENMVVMESKMKTMMTAVALVSDPKSKEMMSSLIENCLSEYKQMAMNGEHNQQEVQSCMAMGMDHSGHMRDKCQGAANLMSCMNKGLPCPIFDDMKMMK
ncbi:uncharacterized protein LOC135941027 isoform X3 [Cloeon dipterum]|uniref:uncharacterized protein LOC135941027 isoform X3 n=1 Tax=Cloeon dipterum TaxID=197152 RepID=UPI0032207055